MSLVSSIKTWFRKTYIVEIPEDNSPYPRIDISVRDASKCPVRLWLQMSEGRDACVEWFGTVEEAEAKANEIKENIRLADEANKRIQEVFHGSRTD